MKGEVLRGGMLIAVALLIASLAVSPKKAEAATRLVTKSISNTSYCRRVWFALGDRARAEEA
jgi:hypothetical protein